MTCQSCGSPLTPGARFCASCGTPSAAACPACGTTLPDSARFCPSCGTATGDAAPAAEAPETERKVATLLFADLVGFTSLGERHDPELVGALVGRTFDRLSEEVGRYEGLIEKFAGDAMLAIFGVPQVHEDDAERAVRAALEMQAAMGELATEAAHAGRPELSLRIGIETGEVLVNRARVARERDRMVTGDAVNTAARLQQAAAPGTVVVGPGTYAITRDVVDYEELPAAVLKGKLVPVAAWRAVAVKARRGGLRAPLGLEAPLVGRDEEMGLLKETVRRTVAEGRPHMVTVVGVAGVGKSRLTWELEKYLDGLPDTFHWRKGRSLAYAQASYSALADVVKSDARIRDDDTPTDVAASLDARLAELEMPPVGEVRDALAALLGLDAHRALARDDLFDAWRKYLEAIARAAPLVLVLEDIHWADEGLLDFIEFLARWSESPLLILCLARHELLERRPAWGGGIPNASTIVLEPLDAAEAQRFLDGLLGSALPDTLRNRIAELSGGNPLFGEELVRMFVDRGVLRFGDGRWELARPVEELEIPGSVHAVLAARLDGLPAAEKRIAQNASVVGRIFWDAALVHLARTGPASTADLLRRLRVKELVVPREPSSLAGAAEFGFRHVLIRDVAYDSLPKRERGSLHLEVARWAERELADRAEEMAELLAAHYVAALRYEEEFATTATPDLAQLRESTYRWARAAGRRASSLGQLDQAAYWLRIAVDQSRQLGVATAEHGQLALEYFRGAQGYESFDTVDAVVREAIERLEALPVRSGGDERTLAALIAARAFVVFQSRDDPDEARSLLRDGIAAREHEPPSAGRAELRARLGWTYWRAGPLAEAIPILEAAIEEARLTGAIDVERWALHDLGVTIAMLGRPRDAIPLVQESRRLAEAANDGMLRARCDINEVSILLSNGERWADVAPLALAGLERARRGVDRGTLHWIAANLCDELAFEGRFEEALGYIEESIEAARAMGDVEMVAVRSFSRDWIRRLMGDRTIENERGDRRQPGSREPQGEIFPVIVTAWSLFASDPHAAVDRVRDAVERATAFSGRLEGGTWLMRLAHRTSDQDAVVVGAAAVHGVVAGCSGPLREIDAEFASAMTLPPADAADALARVAHRWEGAECPLPAANAWTDAALAARRAGLEATAYEAQAMRLYGVVGAVPPLGPLPELRWVTGTEAVERVESRTS